MSNNIFSSVRALSIFVLFMFFSLITKDLLTSSIVVLPLIFNYISFSLQRRNPILTIITIVYVTIFVFRYMAIATGNSQILFGAGVIDRSSIALGMRIIALSFSAMSLLSLVLQELLLKDFKRNNFLLPDSFETTNDCKVLKIFARVLSFLSLSGFILMLVVVKSITNLKLIVFSHEKSVGQYGHLWVFGQTLWWYFSAPAIVFGIVLWRITKRLISPMIIILIILEFYVFGSRLTIFLVFAAVIFILITINMFPKQIRRTTLYFGLPFLIFSFEYILNSRTHTNSYSQSTIDRVGAFTYPVLDAFTLIITQGSVLAPFIYSSTRFQIYLSNLMPQFLSPNKTPLTYATLDSLIAQNLGTSAQKLTSGFPTSVAGEPYLVGGTSLVVVYSLLFILILTFFFRGIISIFSRKPVFAILFCFSFCNFLVTILKDGDTLSTTFGAIKNLLWLITILVTIQLISSRTYLHKVGRGRVA